MRPRAVLLRLAVGLTVASASIVAPSDAAAAIPDEPGAVVLPDTAILQAVVADLDGDGSRELIRLIRGEAGSAHVEVWRLADAGWAAVGDPVQVVEPMELLAPGRAGPWEDPNGRPVRMLVHRADGTERVLVATQMEILETPCRCLSIQALQLHDGGLRLASVAEPSGAVDGVLVIDLDGDRTDELLTVLSLPPLGDISYPSQAGVYRWADGAFGAPTITELPVGSGDTPIHIGDTDGRPGSEAAFFSTLGPPGLFRIVWGPGDTLSVDGLREMVTSAIGVPTPSGTAIATASGAHVAIRRWPAFASPEEPVASATVAGAAELIGVVELDGRSLLLVDESPAHRIHAFSVPELQRDAGFPSGFQTMGRFSGLPLQPYRGPIPGGGLRGGDTLVVHGLMLPSHDPNAPSTMIAAASLAGAQPLGLAGPADSMAILHVPRPGEIWGPSGGRLVSRAALEGAWVSIAPLSHVLTAEPSDATLDVQIGDGAAVMPGSWLVSGSGGFSLSLEVPEGTRLVWVDVDSGEVEMLDAAANVGGLGARIVPPELPTPNGTYSAALLAMTPAGHAYVARWTVQVITQPPELSVDVTTPFASSGVIVSGRTSPQAAVTVGGEPVEVGSDGRFSAEVAAPPWPTEVTVEASDFVGNVAREVVSGIGWFDYRRLPWVPIVGVLVAAAAVLLYLRGPRPAAALRVEDDARLEDMEAD